MDEQILDCSGLFCPEPVIRTSARVKEMEPGQVLRVVGTDLGMQIDIPAWCFGHGHQVLGVDVQDGVVTCRLCVCQPGR